MSQQVTETVSEGWAKHTMKDRSPLIGFTHGSAKNVTADVAGV